MSLSVDGLDVLDLATALSPEFTRAEHMSQWAALLERSDTEAVRALCALPIRHYKSETTLAGIVWLLIQDPTRRIIFLAHNFEAAQSKGKRLRDLARQTDFGPVRGTDTISEWRNNEGGGVVLMSAEQSKLGYDCHVLIFDDPIDEFGSQDPKVRDAVDQTISHYTARCMRKGKPGPVLGVMSRWHPDDPIGRRLMRSAVKWEYVCCPAIIDEGLETERAFAPDVWDLPALKQMRAELKEVDPTERLWHSQLMADPKPPGADLFGPPTFYASLPTFGGYRVVAGIDLAYTTGDGSDWFAAVVGRVYGDKLYITDVQRHKINAHQIESTLKASAVTHGRSTFFSYMSGPEIGFANVLRERGVPISAMHARYNKLVRAQRTIARWNNGSILIPSGALWGPSFIHRVSRFTGRERDSDDDEVDALVSLIDGNLGSSSGAVKTLGKGYQGF